MKDRKLTRHHPFCQSRKKNDEVCYWPASFHRNFHFIFLNMVVEEIHRFIDTISEVGTQWTLSEINQLIEDIKKGRR